VGGIAGGIAIGALADALGAKALTTSLFLLGSIPVLCAYQAYGAVSMQCNSALLLASGVMVTGASRRGCLSSLSVRKRVLQRSGCTAVSESCES
jgi:nitrate/nitrite transporter NarK